MSEQENLKVVQEAYDAFKRGDIPTVLSKMTDDVQWAIPGPPGIAVAGQRHGAHQVAEFFKTLGEEQEPQEFAPREFIPKNDKVIVLGHFRWLVKRTGRILESDWVHVFTLRDGKVASFQEYSDSARLVEAYGSAAAASR
ncbi:MAG: nuclear transport factor 2 family protein [Candidatus Eremiobacteraeota bacterium]|nr:nuclear transport factor 2 family protein [Candidatus Eremiobacteraeota bacterium]